MKDFALHSEFPGTRDQKRHLFKVLDRVGNVCLLEKWNPLHPSGNRYYEVVILRSVPDRTFPNGNRVPAHLSLPSPEEWGLYGWSPANLEAARKKFNQATP